MEIFRGAAIVRLENFSVFASIPQGAKQRKKELEKLIQSFRVHNKNLKYQIRNGTRNLKLMLKFQEPNDFQFFREVSIDDIDAFNIIPEMELETPDAVDESPDQLNETPPTDMAGWQEKKRKENKKRKNLSPIQIERKRKRNEYSPANMVNRIYEYLYGDTLSIHDNLKKIKINEQQYSQ